MYIKCELQISAEYSIMKNTIPKNTVKKKRSYINNIEHLPHFCSTIKTVNSSQRQSPYASLRRSCKNTISSKCESMENLRRSSNNQSVPKKKDKENKSNKLAAPPQISSYTHTPKNYQTQADEDIGLFSMRRENFKFMYQIGFGGFGKVWKVQERVSWEYYAMKEIQKRKVIQKDSVDCIMNEKRVLGNLKHPFLVNIKYAFQDKNCLYLIMDYLKGADLRYHICYRQSFSEIETKFILACLILAVEQIHSRGIIHRDIKPENLVLEQTGYVRLTDFGIAKYTKQLKESTGGKYDSSGTPGYMAPEVMMKEGYNQMSDFFAIGVIGYELMLNKRPYCGRNRKQIKQKIQEEQVQIRKEEVPYNWSDEAVHFINKLIVCNPKQRLGCREGMKQLKQHTWMSDISWRRLLKKEIIPPFIPNIVCETKEYLEQIQSYNQVNQEEDRTATNGPLTLQQNRLFEGYELIKQSSPFMTPLRNIRNTLERERDRTGMEKAGKPHNRTKKQIKMQC